MPDIIFNGPAGRLEGRYQPAKAPQPPTVLILHPHPQGGGTMNNKVVYHLFHTFVGREFAALRFNFRGVGRSQGSFDHGQGELADAAAALDWLQAHNPDSPRCWIAGFSFGAWIGLQLLMRRPEIEGFVMIAPPANLYDFSFLAPCPASGMIIQGDKDELVPEADGAKLAHKLQSQRDITVDYKLIKGANHFFVDHLEEMTSTIDKYLQKALSAPPGKVAKVG